LDRRDIELEDFASWPEELRGFVEARRRQLVAYQRERQRIDRLGWTDVRVRVEPPPNEHRPAYEEAVAHAEALLHGHRLVGYHCTRLTPDEMRRIRTEGLRALSPNLVQERLEALVDAGEMSRAQCDFFLHSAMLQAHLANRHGNRTGMVWLCPNRSTLRDSSGVFRLFRSWGGEALYAGFERDASAFGVLSRLGVPAIVKCAVTLPTDALHGCRAANLLSNAVRHEIEHPEPSPTFDWCVRRDLEPTEVVDIVVLDDPRFEELTGHAQWPEDHRLAEARPAPPTIE
jgi:hypothetical protein